MDVFDDSLGELLRGLMRLVTMNCGCDAAFCYVGCRGDEDVIPGAMAVGDEFCMLPARPVAEVFFDAPSTGWVSVARGEDCPTLFARFPSSKLFADSYVLYLREPGQGPCVCGVRYDPSARLHDSLPARLKQLAPALSATTRLHDASLDLLDCWARLSTTLTEVCSVIAAQISESRATYGLQPLEAARRPLPASSALATQSFVLSNRERQIGELLVAGYAAVNAAAVLGISEHTVRTYVRRLYRKLGVTNRADFVRRFIAVAGPEAVAGVGVGVDVDVDRIEREAHFGDAG